MELMQIINEIASLLICVNATLFYIFIFGRQVKKIENLHLLEQWLLRIGLILPALGGFYNLLVASYPPNVEIIINVGYAALFTWASIFHYKQFVRR